MVVNSIESNQDGPVIVAVDLGNTGAKVRFMFISDGKLVTREITLPHGYMQLGDMQWSQEEAATKMGRGRSSETHTFKIKGGTREKPIETAVKFGKAAVTAGAAETLYGNAKYFEGYIDAYLAAVFCEIFPKRHFPDGYGEIYLAFGVPPSDWAMTSILSKLLIKTHKITDPDGKRRSFKVKMGMAIDENTGGTIRAMEYLLTNSKRDSQSNQFRSIKAGQQIIVVDSGGFLGSMAWAEISETGMPVIDHNSGRIFPIPSGIVKVRAELRATLKHYYTLETQGMGMSDAWLDEVIANESFTLSGNKKLYDAKPAIKDSVGIYVSQQKAAWALCDYGKEASHVLMSGGTTTPLFKHLTAVYNHNSVILADDLKDIYMANVRGFMQIFLDSLIADNVLPEIFKPHFNSVRILS